MKRLFKIIGIVLGVLVAVLVAAALLIPLFFNPNDYKGQIAALIEKQIGRNVTIEGNLALSVFPWLGVKTGPVQVANAQGFGNEPFARIAGADIRVKLLPLLHREVEMDTVRLDGLVLNLARNEKGRTNWDDLLEAKAEAGAPAAPPAGKRRTEERKPGGQALGAMALGGIQIRSAKVDWNDRQAGTRYTLTQVDLRSGEIELGKPFDLSTEFDFQAPKQALNGHMALSGEVSIDPNAARYQFKDAKVTALVKGKNLPPEGVEGRLTTNIAADLGQQTLTVPQLAMTVAGINVNGSLKGSRILDAPTFQGTLRVAEFSPREVLKRFGQALPATADPKALSQAQADLELAASLQRLQLAKLAMKLDASTLSGSAEVREFAKPKIAFDLTVDNIDVDRYLPPPETTPKPKAATPAGTAAAAAGELPVDALRSLNLNGTLRVGQMKVYGLRTSDVRLAVAAKDGVTRVQPATANLYQGKYEGNMSLDVRGKAPQLTMNDKLAGVQAGPLLKDLSGKERITGVADLNAQLGMSGQTMDAMLSSLNGNASFAFRDGAVKGINIAALIRNAQATIRGGQLPAEQTASQTDFTELTGTLNIVDGVVHNRDLSAKSPLLRVTGEGSVNLKTERIDYLLKTVLVKTLKGQGGKGMEDLAGIPIPVRIAGTLSDPSFRPDLEAAVGEKVRGKVEQKVEEKREELKKSVEDKLQERLKKLLPR